MTPKGGFMRRDGKYCREKKKEKKIVRMKNKVIMKER